MKRLSRILQIAISVLFVASISLQGVQPAAAQDEGGVRIARNAHTGMVSFIGADPGHPIVVAGARALSMSPEARGLALLAPFAADLGLRDAGRELRLESIKRPAGRVSTRYQQMHGGIPVMAGELIVNADDAGDLISISGEIAPDLELDATPVVTAEAARDTALNALAKWRSGEPGDFQATEPQLWIYDSRLLEPDGLPASLVWRMDVTAVDAGVPLRELVLVDAQRGNIRLHFNQVDTSWAAVRPLDEALPSPTVSRDVRDENSVEPLTTATEAALVQQIVMPTIATYDMGHAVSPLPGSFVCDETDTGCTNGTNPHADGAERYALGTYAFYLSNYGRNSIDDAGMSIISSVHYRSGYDNAGWTGAQMVYGDAHAYPLADDVVAHELTHGVTQYESNLFYYYQSGAINESFSDLWGEIYDQQNASGNDAPASKWLIGEDVTGAGPFRSMSDPRIYSDPDMMLSPSYYEGDLDNGGVHANSGVNNKAAYLMVDGGTFNSKTVVALGADKTLAIYYEAQTHLLTSGADYADLYNVLYQACYNLIDGALGIVSGDCDQVRNATDAVEMNFQPATDFNTDAPMCDGGEDVNTILSDDLESGTRNWNFTVPSGTGTRWQYDQPDYGLGSTFAHSGLHHLFADDYPAAVTDARAQLVPVAIPANAYLHFYQAYDFERYAPVLAWYDGGVLEYSTNGGAVWQDAGSLMDYNGYRGTVRPGNGNPLAWRSAFVGTSHGYISTRVNLSSLAGQAVTFRWRMGLDNIGSMWGWWLDDVRVYTCGATTAAQISGNAGVAGATLSYLGVGPQIPAASGTGDYTVPALPGWSGTVTPFKMGYVFSPASYSYNNLSGDQTGQNFTATAYPGAGIYDDADAGWSYGGVWFPVAAPGLYKDGMNVGVIPGGTASFTFYGSQFVLTYVQYSITGNIAVYLDGSPIPVAMIDANGPAALAKYTSPGLSLGLHTVTFVHAGPAGKYMGIDSLEVRQPPVVGSGAYDLVNPALSLAGSWMSFAVPGLFGNTLHLAMASGNSSTMLFHGTGFSLTYIQYGGTGGIAIYLDGSSTPYTIINSNGTTGLTTYTSPILPLGDHVLKVGHAGPLGALIGIDSVTILP